MDNSLYLVSKYANFLLNHTSSWNLEVENNLDPDDGNSLVCGACRLPIFSTPFITTADDIILHDQCANLPNKLEGHVLHPAEPLVRRENRTTTNTCSRCRSTCGTVFYNCDYLGCKIQLDVLCALAIKILHRSHEHRLTAEKGTSYSFICAVCGTQHRSLQSRSSEWDMFQMAIHGRAWRSLELTSYRCSFCDFWIHPDCAVIPNAIMHHDHKHPLLLKYDLKCDLGVEKGPRFADFMCAICDSRLEYFGFYFCGICPYYAHVKCVLSNPRGYDDNSNRSRFKPVLIREALLPNFLRLPLANEHTSLMQCIVKTITNGGGESGGASSSSSSGSGGGGDHTITNHDGDHDQSGKLLADKHEHPLILHDGCDDDDHAARDIDNRRWYYGCDLCEQSFHASCIPSLDNLSNIKFGFTVRVECHDCPVACVRALTVYGYKCGYCQVTFGQEDIRLYKGLAFECSKCYFRIHFKCCLKSLKDENVIQIEIAEHSP
ncbi:hypothetical protein PHJA_001951900 [Phtheirospermum japonicum]|uniref:Uncharacterized protein n=1 Tax=Phtheirospermum japonicum TaxID=374723 RepID=A0A830CLC9_9LAMI|nr:hypothetical protein PHJA_001951900 [Phtheirospermum japonicum]